MGNEWFGFILFVYVLGVIFTPLIVMETTNDRRSRYDYTFSAIITFGVFWPLFLVLVLIRNFYHLIVEYIKEF